MSARAERQARVKLAKQIKALLSPGCPNAACKAGLCVVARAAGSPSASITCVVVMLKCVPLTKNLIPTY